MKMIKELLDGANALGACRKTDGIDTLDKLVALYESPQGREFCARHHYPSRRQWIRIREHWSREKLRERNIYVDEAYVRCACNPGTVVAVGSKTCLHVTLNGAEEAQRIIAIRGAKVTICAENYAVYEIINDGTADVAITKDETAVQL